MSRPMTLEDVQCLILAAFATKRKSSHAAAIHFSRSFSQTLQAPDLLSWNCHRRVALTHTIWERPVMGWISETLPHMQHPALPPVKQPLGHHHYLVKRHPAHQSSSSHSYFHCF